MSLKRDFPKAEYDDDGHDYENSEETADWNKRSRINDESGPENDLFNNVFTSMTTYRNDNLDRSYRNSSSSAHSHHYARVEDQGSSGFYAPSGGGGSDAHQAPSRHTSKQMQQQQQQQNPNGYSTFAQSMMAKMGYQEGKGLGKDESGISAPIQSHAQTDKMGLGYDNPLRADFEASFNQEIIFWDKKVEWLDSYEGELPDEECLVDWMEFGERKYDMNDETLFCKAQLLSKMLSLKSQFDHLNNFELTKARSRANPYESLKNAIFQNRAALKMADMDYATEFIFSEPKLPSGESMLQSDQPDLLLFADICAGPGGFTEYLTWRRGWRCKGWGLTLKDPESGSDFKLDKFLAGSADSFEPYYGVGGADGDGDILKTANIDQFRSYVMKYSQPEGGVHVVMADGGFSVAGNENMQEVLSKHLILCQMLCAFSILCDNGNFLCKLFDCFTLFTSSLVYLAHMCFHSVGIYKPITSRPANSERYLICKGYKGQVVCEKIIAHLRNMSEHMHSLRKDISGGTSEDNGFSEQDAISLIPFEQLTSSFKNYLTNSNNDILIQQIAALEKVIQFVKNPNLVEHRQKDIRDGYLDKWKIPNEARREKLRIGPVRKFAELCPGHNGMKHHASDEEELTKNKFKTFLSSVHEYRFLFIGSALPREIWLSEGSRHVHSTEDLVRWKKVEGPYEVELPKDTILEVEKVHEHKIEGKGTCCTSDKVLHITDAVMIGGQSIENKSFKDRLHFAEQLVRAVSKPSQTYGCRLRVKELIRLEYLEERLNGLELRKTNQRVPSPRNELSVILPDSYFYQCHGIRIVRILKTTYSMCISKSTGKFYFFDKRTGSSQFQCPPSASASFWDCKRVEYCAKWSKEPGVQFSLEEEYGCPLDRLSRAELLEHINILKNSDKHSPSKLSSSSSK